MRPAPLRLSSACPAGVLTSALQKLVAQAFHDEHDIEEELDLDGQNERLAIYTSPNFGSDDEAIYRRVHDFISSRNTESRPLQERIHCVWYCVASEEERPISRLETRFFSGEIASIAPQVPVILAFTKYDDFVSKVQLDWSKDAEERGLSKVAVTHILNDLTANRFNKTIGKRWDEVMLDEKGKPKGRRVPRVCVASGTDPEDDDSTFEALTTTTLESLGEWKESRVRLAFAAAQRSSATISTKCRCHRSSDRDLCLHWQTAPKSRRSTTPSTRATRARPTASRFAISCPTSGPRRSKSST